MKDADSCPCCQHSLTMAVESQAGVNAKNRELQTKASADGGDGKFKAVSALHGCYCYSNNCCGHRGGYGCTECMRKAADGKTAVDHGPGVCGFDCFFCGCDCKCVFMDHNRQKIAARIVREKVQLEKQGNTSKSGGSDPSPEETGRYAWTQYIMTEINNQNVRENQHVDGRSPDELLQDVATLAVNDAYSNPIMAAMANVSWGLQKVIPLTGLVKYCTKDGSKRPMTLAKAIVGQKRQGEVSVVDRTPPAIDFLRNNNSSNCIHCNGLSAMMGSSATTSLPAPAAAVTNPAASVSMIKRVMKRAGDTFFSRAALPATKKATGKVCAQLSRVDAAYTSIVDDYKAEKNLQELFQYCLEQATLDD
jgi:hypothetical protein